MKESKPVIEHYDVIIVGAGPTGLTLACDLARRGLKIRIIDASSEAFKGSRGKGIQPRTLEVFDNLGIAEPILRAGDKYSPMGIHLSFLKIKWRMIKLHKKTPEVPYPNTWLVPQWRTEEVLRNRLKELGHSIEYNSRVFAIEQDETDVSIQVNFNGEYTTLRSRYLVGADGGKSFVRKNLGVNFSGVTSQEGRMIVGDIRVDGLSRDCWHVWPKSKGGLVGLCPIPHSDLFQLMMKLPTSEENPELSEAAIQARWIASTGLKNIRLHSPAWLSVFRPNVRLVEKYRVGRVFLAGDAAHIHTPAGAQGLNTGVQDAFNLGWKLALALGGAPESILDTYEEERKPVAAGVLKLSSERFKSIGENRISKPTRGDEERQLLLNYRSSSITKGPGPLRKNKLAAGDRAPDAICSNRISGRTSLFDAFRGGHFTLLVFGSHATNKIRAANWQSNNLMKEFSIERDTSSNDSNVLFDDSGKIQKTYGVTGNESITFLVRPDGYIAHMATGEWRKEIQSYFTNITGYPLT